MSFREWLTEWLRACGQAFLVFLGLALLIWLIVELVYLAGHA